MNAYNCTISKQAPASHRELYPNHVGIVRQQVNMYVCEYIWKCLHMLDSRRYIKRVVI